MPHWRRELEATELNARPWRQIGMTQRVTRFGLLVVVAALLVAGFVLYQRSLKMTRVGWSLTELSARGDTLTIDVSLTSCCHHLHHVAVTEQDTTVTVIATEAIRRDVHSCVRKCLPPIARYVVHLRRPLGSRQLLGCGSSNCETLVSHP